MSEAELLAEQQKELVRTVEEMEKRMEKLKEDEERIKQEKKEIKKEKKRLRKEREELAAEWGEEGAGDSPSTASGQEPEVEKKMANRKKLTREERLEKKRQAEKLRYLRIKNDAQKYAEQKQKEKQKYKRKKEKGIIKTANQMTPRERRKARKIWREKAAKRRRRLALQNISQAPITPPSCDNEAPRNQDGRAIAAKRKSDRVRRSKNNMIKKQDRKIAQLQTKVERYRKRLQRLKKTALTPNSKVDKLIASPSSTQTIKKKLLFEEVLKRQLKENFSTLGTDKERKLFRRVISGRLVDKYGILQKKRDIRPLRKKITKLRLIDPKRQIRKDKLCLKLQRQVTMFFEDDSNSRVCPGKKDFVKRKGVRKTKRVLLDTLSNLHKKFKEREHVLTSYSAFCNLRPFWVTFPRCDERDTCLCIAHANIDLTLAGLSQAKIISIRNHQGLLEKICCDRYNEKCLSRECHNCQNKGLRYNEFDDSVPIMYKKWLSATEEITDPKTKKLRKVTKYTKKICQSYPREVIIQFESDLKTFLQHELNIWHQYKTMKTLKARLTEKDCLIHMDFSENYQTKFAGEIQSFHFRGSRLQISLHTVVVYTRDATEESGVKTDCYCTMAKNLAHSPAAIWAHLKPILTELPASIQNLHFLSDGPVTQYRNKTMFHLLATTLKDFFPNLGEFSWNYHEAGHGKGAPDGVGGVVKRTADGIVATGTDITSLNDLASSIEKSCPNIKVVIIPDSDISEKEALVRGTEKNVKTFVGTLKVHQVVGNIFSPNRLTMKTLSCFCDLNCSHYRIGTLTCTPSRTDTRLRVEDVYESESESEIVPQPSTSSNERKLQNGDFLLVKFLLKKKTEYRYVAICTGVEEDDEIQVNFCKVSDKKGCLFKVNEQDISFITKDQIVEILPTPNLTLKGQRMFYTFKTSIDVFEQA